MEVGFYPMADILGTDYVAFKDSNDSGLNIETKFQMKGGVSRYCLHVPETSSGRHQSD
jgi:hypothetical protein